MMQQARTPIRLALVVSLMITTMLTISVAAAQEEQRRITDTTGSMGGTANFQPSQTSYTATDDLWTWRSTENRTSIQSTGINSTMLILGVDDFESEQTSFFEPGDFLQLRHRMQVDLRAEPSTNTEPVRGQNVSVSGRAEGRLAVYEEMSDSDIVSSLRWKAKISGSGWCSGDECTIQYEITGTLSDADGQRACGDLSITTQSVVNNSEQTWTFVQTEADEVNAAISLRIVIDFPSSGVAEGTDGVTCISGITGDSKTLTGDVTFYYGDETNDPKPFTPEPTRVMPGDNVTIIAYRDMPVRLLESLETPGDTLWDPTASPLLMTQDMWVELRRPTEELFGAYNLRGEVRGVFPSGVVAEGLISGEGTCGEDGVCTIQMIRTLEIFEALQKENIHTRRCGAMELSVTVVYVPGDATTPPKLTFGTDGTGTMTLRDHPRCVLDSMESMSDI
jgi:hypothetical protein